MKMMVSDPVPSPPPPCPALLRFPPSFLPPPEISLVPVLTKLKINNNNPVTYYLPTESSSSIWQTPTHFHLLVVNVWAGHLFYLCSFSVLHACSLSPEHSSSSSSSSLLPSPPSSSLLLQATRACWFHYKLSSRWFGTVSFIYFFVLERGTLLSFKMGRLYRG